jgi:hypothetical protein
MAPHQLQGLYLDFSVGVGCRQIFGYQNFRVEPAKRILPPRTTRDRAVAFSSLGGQD